MPVAAKTAPAPVAEIIDDWDDFDAPAAVSKQNAATVKSTDAADDLDFDNLPLSRTANKPLPKKKKLSDKVTPKAKKKKPARVYEDRTPGGLWMTVLFGGVAGLVGAVVWGAVGYFTGYEIGWLAWGIGVACGAAVNASAGDADETMTGIVAVICSLGSIALGKYLIVYFLLQKLAGDLGIDLSDTGVISIVDVLKETVGPFDALWVFLAAVSAYKLGSGGGDDD